MAASISMRLISPFRLWLVSSITATTLLLGTGIVVSKTVASQNQRFISSQMTTLIRARTDDLIAGRYRDFVEGIGADFNELHIRIATRGAVFEVGPTDSQVQCAETQLKGGGFGSEPIDVKMCRPFPLPIWPMVIVLAIFVVGSIFSLLLFRGFETRATLTLAQFIESCGVTLPKSRRLSDILGRIKQIRFDLDEARARELALAKAEERASMAEQVAHDIRSPLSVLDALLGGLTGVPERRRVVVRGAINSIRDIANDLLEKKPAAELPTAAIEDSGGLNPCLVLNLLDKVVSEKRLQYRARPGLEIELVQESGAYGLFAGISPVLLRRLLSNILNNAIEALNGGRGLVQVRLERLDGTCGIIVRDNGKGMPRAVVEALGRAPLTHGKEAGRGLGIYHAFTSLAQCGGRLEIESEVGSGTSVKVVLPTVDAPRWFANEIEVADDADVVVVDDDPFVNEIWRERLVSARGVKIHFFTNYDEFIAWSGTAVLCSPLFLLDYEFAGMALSGLDVAARLSAQARTILVTSRDEERSVQGQCEAAGVRMIPKGAASLVPIRVVSSGESAAAPVAILIDDNIWVRETWEIQAAERGRRVATFGSVAEFENAALASSVDIPLFLDHRLSGTESGLDAAARFHARGFRRIYLATGVDAKNLRPGPWIQGVIGKEVPEWVFVT